MTTSLLLTYVTVDGEWYQGVYVDRGLCIVQGVSIGIEQTLRALALHLNRGDDGFAYWGAGMERVLVKHDWLFPRMLSGVDLLLPKLFMDIPEDVRLCTTS